MLLFANSLKHGIYKPLSRDMFFSLVFEEMYKLLALILITASSTQAGEWVTVFEDNFDGTSLNANNWQYETGNGFQGMNRNY